jgi:hypothetical protein
MNKTLIATTSLMLIGIGALAADATDTGATNATPASTTNYRGGRFGAGLILGEPTGASLKYWLNDTLAVDGAIGWSFHRETDLHLHSDVLWHKFDLISVPEGRMPLYFGVGARVKFRDNDDDQVGIRVPVGVSYIFEKVPVDIFLEVAPVIDFTPSVRGGFTAGIGARYWF